MEIEIDARFAAERATWPRRQADAQPDGVRMLRELEAKQLSQGACANLAAIRAIVGLPKKVAGK